MSCESIRGILAEYSPNAEGLISFYLAMFSSYIPPGRSSMYFNTTKFHTNLTVWALYLTKAKMPKDLGFYFFSRQSVLLKDTKTKAKRCRIKTFLLKVESNQAEC